jgi:hypothetical protein
MLIQHEDLRGRFVRLVGRGRVTTTTRAFTEATDRLSRFLLTQFMVNAGFGMVVALCAFLVGLPYALLWGILAGVLRYLPYVGTWLALGLILLFSVAVFPGWTQALTMLGLLIALELVTANVVEPVLFGHSAGVSPVALLVAVAYWTWLWGPIGLVLSTPLTVCLVVLGRYAPSLKFLEVLLSQDASLEPDVNYYQRLLATDQDEAADLVEEYVTSHSPEAVYDDILVPALTMARRDREKDELTREEEQFIVQATEDIVEDLASILPTHDQEGGDEYSSGVPGKALVFGCPARDHIDELTLRMLAQLMQRAGFPLEVLSNSKLTAEVLSRIDEEHCAGVCIGVLPPGGMSQTRYLCKRLRAQFPDLTIVVGLWGLKENLEHVRQRLTAAGANHVATRLLDARDRLAPLAQSLSHVEPVKSSA